MVTRQNFLEVLLKTIPTVKGYESSSHERPLLEDTAFKATIYFQNDYCFDVQLMPRIGAYKIIVGKFRVNKSPDGNTFQLIDKPSKHVSSSYHTSAITIHKKIKSFDYSSNNLVTIYSNTVNYIAHLIFLSSIVSKL